MAVAGKPVQAAAEVVLYPQDRMVFLAEWLTAVALSTSSQTVMKRVLMVLAVAATYQTPQDALYMEVALAAISLMV